MSDGQQDNTEPQPSEDDTETTETTEAVAPNPAVPQILNVERFSVFNEGLLYYATKLLLKELKMDTGEGGAQSGDDADRELDSVMEFPEVRKPLNTPDEVLQYWNVCYEKETLSHLHFREWWRQKVPKIFNPIPSMNYQKPTEHIEEDDVKKYFFDLLERFLCNGDPSEVLKQLSSLNSPPAQCGKVFKMGEPTYSCRDCGLDPTCVLCVDCFKNSEHGSHRYKMSTSVGGGYCDCGDKEAWKDHPYCATHVLGTQANSSDPLAKVPLDIQLRARHVFTGVLKYAYELLTLDTFMKLPGDLQYKERDSVDPLLDDLLEVEDMYTTVLYNDEVPEFLVNNDKIMQPRLLRISSAVKLS